MFWERLQFSIVLGLGTAEGIGIIIERSFNDFGQPTAYIEGEEFSGAFFGGLRYGGGKIYFKDGTCLLYTSPSPRD